MTYGDWKLLEFKVWLVIIIIVFLIVLGPWVWFFTKHKIKSMFGRGK